VTEESEVALQLTARELRLVIAWKDGDTFFPDEERVLRKLRQALEAGEPARLSRLQLQILNGWAEEQVGGHYGGGEVRNPDEAAILNKIRDSLSP
jgi:hypothetical protein